VRKTTYFYKARTPEGGLVSGSMLAQSSDDIVAHLRTRALFITSIAPADSFTGRIESVRTMGPVSPPPMVTFFRSFATLIHAGVSVSRSLRVTIAQCPDARLREALQAVLAEIEQGRSLSSSMRLLPREFAPLYIAMVEAGEAGGMLDEVLERLACMLEKDLAMRKKVGAALAYPIVVLCAAIGLIFVLLATIVPTLGRFFLQLNVEQPPSARALLLAGDIVRNPVFWGMGVAGVAALMLLFAIARKDLGVAAMLDAARLRIPLLGSLHRKAVTARLGRMLGSLLHSGVDVLRAIDVCAPVTGNAVYVKALRDLHSALRDGASIADQLEHAKIFDPMLLQMVRVGEETGTLDAMLLKTAEYYESDVETMTATLGSTIEPLLILMVGAVVGLIVYSVFVPMYAFVSNLGR
jgi:type IV pilus assembly protein PilC